MFPGSADIDLAGVLNVLRLCALAGKPIRSLLLLVLPQWSPQMKVYQVKQNSPKTEVSRRWFFTDFNWLRKARPPDYFQTDNRAAGRAYFTEYAQTFVFPDSDAMLADYHQSDNEPTQGDGWPVEKYSRGTASWCQGVMDAGDSLGIRPTLYNWSYGFPPLEFWRQPEQWDVLRRAKERDAQGKTRARILIHGYLNPDSAPGVVDTAFLLRHKSILAQLPSDLQDVEFEYGEFLSGYARDRFTWNDLDRLIVKVDGVLADDPNVVSLDTYGWGTGGNERDNGPADWSKYLGSFGQYLVGF